MASYYVRYNNVDLTNKIGVRTVDTTVLPPRENNSILIWERPGSLYNAYRYSERIITVTFLIKGSSNADVENRLNDLRNIFRVDSPKALYLGTPSRFIYAVPDGDFKMKELRYDCYECEITFVCHDPEYYSSSVSSSSNRSMARSGGSNNMIDVYNGSNASTYPIINIGINNTASFVQVENTTTGQKMLLGKYPDPNKSLKESTAMTHYDMTSTTEWDALSSTDKLSFADMGFGGTLTVTSSGKGFKLDTVGTGDWWKGIGRQKTLSNSLSDFRVRARINFNSYGSNGDPHTPCTRDEGTVTAGSKKTYYKVMAPGISVKDAPNGLTIGTISKGSEVWGQTITKGWVQINKVTINGEQDYTYQDGYCELTSLKKYIRDNTSTDMVMNIFTYTDIELRSMPSHDMTRSKLLSTIPSGEYLRVYREPVDGFYKLYTKYNNMIGYVDMYEVNVAESFDSIVTYPEDECIINEDLCTGICEVVGIDSFGTSLFRLTVTDDNEFYEFTRPSITIGDPNNAVINATPGVLLEDKASVPKSNKPHAYNSDELNVDYDYLEQGSQGGWNNFYGELGVEKDGDKWRAWIYKIENGATVKKLELGETDVLLENLNNVEAANKLSKIVVYIGTKDSNYRCGMSVSDIYVEELNVSIGSEEAIFRPGDEIQIDCCNNRVYLNNQLFNNIDIGSDFIELVSGSNDIKVTSNDRNIHATVLFNERYL